MKHLLQETILVFVAYFLPTILWAQDLWDGETIATSFHAGVGTSANPYEIRTAAQLKYFEQQVNTGNSFEGKTIRLMNNIDLGCHSLEIKKTFSGTFDGNGYFIELIFLQNAMFQDVMGTIKHLGIRSGVYRFDRYPYYGKIYLAQTLENEGVIENCYYNLCKKDHNYDIYIIDYRPTLVGSNYGIIRNCYAQGKYSIYDSGGVWGSFLCGMLVDTNNETGIIENCAGSTYNNGLNAHGQQQPLATTNNGTIIDGNNTTLTYFETPDPCTVEFVDLQFANTISPKTIVKGQPIGTLPSPTAKWSFVGWKRYGQFVTENSLVEENWALFAQWEQRIRKQPTASSMSVEVDDAEHAAFLWYYSNGEEEQLGQWESTNHGGDTSSSETFTFQAQAGQSLMFDYSVSSEEEFDYFSVSLNGKNILKVSGTKSAAFAYTIPTDGDYSLVLRYSKDDDTNVGSDKVTVENIKVSAPSEQLACTQNNLPARLVDRDGLYYCVISYSNTSTVLYTDKIACSKQVVATDITTLTDAIYADATTGQIGAETTLVIGMKNAQTVTAYTFDLELPEGVSITTDSEGHCFYTMGNRHNGHYATINSNSSAGTYSIGVTASQPQVVNKSEGIILTLKLKVADNMDVGEYAVKIHNVKFLSTSGTTTIPEAIGLLTLKGNKKGDMNGDGEVTVTDALMIVDTILSK